MKTKIIYNCTECGGQSAKWVGQCPDCKAWNTLIESVDRSKENRRTHSFEGYAGGAKHQSGVQLLSEVPNTAESRILTGVGELDRALGGGLVAGSVILIGGDPGIGKSTLLLQSLIAMSEQFKTLYVTGEESLQQVRIRADRLHLLETSLKLLAETQVEKIISIAYQEQPQIMVIDSIQTIFTSALQSAPGAVAQLRESTAQFVQFAKKTNIALFLVGHVTKEGVIAGPRVLEHMVDTVLYFEGEAGSRFRMIRAVKNRFGQVNELGVFAMTDTGLKEVSNPSAIFLSRHSQSVPGSVVMVTREGSRPLLVEIQALVDESHGAMPKRITLGLEYNRLSMLLAVLHRHAGIAMHDHDVFINVVGGVKISETAVDLAVVLATISSFRNKPIGNDLVVFGEVGLAGEIRPVPNGEERVREAAKHGFKRAILAKSNAPRKAIEGLQVMPVERINEAIQLIDL